MYLLLRRQGEMALVVAMLLLLGGLPSSHVIAMQGQLQGGDVWTVEEFNAHLRSDRFGATMFGETLVRGSGGPLGANVLRDLFVAFRGGNDTVRMEYKSLGQERGICRLLDFVEECEHGFREVPASDNSSAGTNETIVYVDASKDNARPYFVDFVLMERKFTEMEYSRYPDVQQYPLFAIGVTPVYNVPGVDDLVLSQDVLARIFRQCKADALCEADSISEWDDPDIVALNPSRAIELANAGKIDLVIREIDHTGESTIFRSSLSGFDQGFYNQVGHTTDGYAWTNVSARSFQHGGQVLAYVDANPGSIGYVELKQALEFGAKTPRLLSKTGVPVVASNVAVSLAAKEIGATFEFPMERLAVDISSVNGPRSWPIVGYVYLGVRKNTARDGGTCRGRMILNSFLTWVYIFNIPDSIIAAAGFAQAPRSLKQVVRERLKSDLSCDAQRTESLYLEPEHPTYSMYVDGLMSDFMHLVQLKYNTKYYSQKHGIQVRYANSVDELFGESMQRYPNMIITSKTEWDTNIRGRLPEGYSSVAEYGRVHFMILYDLCPSQSRFSCRAHEIQLKLSISTVAKMLSGEIRYWNDTEIVSTLSEEHRALMPNESIRVVRSNQYSKHDADWESKFTEQMREHVPDFSFYEASVQSHGMESVVKGGYKSEFSVSVAAWIGSASTNLHWIAIRDGFILDEKGQLDEAAMLQCLETAAVPENQGCHPFYHSFVIAAKTQYDSPEICDKGSSFDGQAISFARFFYWFLSPVSTYGALVVYHVAYLGHSSSSPGFESLDEMRIQVSCYGESIVQPKEETNELPASLRGTMILLIVIVSAFLALLALWVHRNRRTKIVKASTPSFLYQLLVGNFISLLAIVPLLQDDGGVPLGRYLLTLPGTESLTSGSTVDELMEIVRVDPKLHHACQAVPFLYSIGFSIVFIPLLLKSWRIVKLFNNKKLRKIAIPNSLLLKYEAVVLAFVIFINVIWAVVDPLQFERFPVWVNEEKIVLESVGGCYCENPGLWLGPLVAYIVFCLLYGNYLSFQGRNVPVQFSEGKWVAVSLLNFTQTVLLCVPVVAATTDDPVVAVIVKSLFVIIANFGTIVIIFGPKLYALKINEDSQFRGMIRPKSATTADSSMGNKSNK